MTPKQADGKKGAATRRVARSLAVAVLALPVAACLTAPVGKPGSAPLDHRITGTWTCTSAPAPGEDVEVARLEIVQFDDAQYLAEWREDEKTTRYRAFPTNVRGETLINVNELADRGNYADMWAVLRYRREGSALTIDFLDKKILDTDDKAIRRKLETRPGDASLWRVFARCGPAEADPSPTPTP